jgi:hypothetical protein
MVTPQTGIPAGMPAFPSYALALGGCHHVHGLPMNSHEPLPRQRDSTTDDSTWANPMRPARPPADAGQGCAFVSTRPKRTLPAAASLSPPSAGCTALPAAPPGAALPDRFVTARCVSG